MVNMKTVAMLANTSGWQESSVKVGRIEGVGRWHHGEQGKKMAILYCIDMKYGYKNERIVQGGD